MKQEYIKMKKILCTMLVSVIALVLAACGKIDGIVQTEFAKIINERVSFTEPLTRINDSSVQKRYFINAGEYSEITAYVGTNATTDEFVIIKTDNTDNIVSKLSNYLTQVNSTYSSYRPEEAAKVLSPVFKVYKDTVVLIVTNDTANAEAVFDGYLNGEILP